MTRARKATFLALLETTANVSASARAAGVNRSTPYEDRKADPDFASAWDEALESATDALEAEARRRALGWDEKVALNATTYHIVHKHSDQLMMFLLSAHRPERFGRNAKVEHTGDLTIRVEYADADDPPYPAPSGAGGDPP